MSKKEFALYFCECLNLNTKYIIGNSLKDINLTAKRPNDMRLDSSKLEVDLNIKFSNFDCFVRILKEWWFFHFLLHHELYDVQE